MKKILFKKNFFKILLKNVKNCILHLKSYLGENSNSNKSIESAAIYNYYV